jgi:hypothetical protein
MYEWVDVVNYSDMMVLLIYQLYRGSDICEYYPFF